MNPKIKAQPKSELEFVGCTMAVGAVAFLVGLAGKTGWRATTAILRWREARRNG